MISCSRCHTDSADCPTTILQYGVDQARLCARCSDDLNSWLYGQAKAFLESKSYEELLSLHEKIGLVKQIAKACDGLSSEQAS